MVQKSIKLLIGLLLCLLPQTHIFSMHMAVGEYFKHFIYFLKHLLPVVLCMLFFISSILRQRSLSWAKIEVLLLLTPFILLSLISLVFHNEVNARNVYTALMPFLLVVFCLFIDNNTNGIRLLRLLVYSTFLGLLLAIALSIIFGLPLFYVYEGERKRWLFGFEHPGYFSGILYGLAILSSYLSIIEKKKKLLYFVFFSIIIIIFTDTRNATICLVIIFIFYFWRNYPKRLVAGFLMLMLTIASIIPSFIPEIDKASSYRLSMWKYGIDYNLNGAAPIFGRGLTDSIRPDIKGQIIERGDNKLVFHIDNYYLEVFIEYGVFGLLTLLLFLLEVFITLLRERNRRLMFFKIGVFTSLVFYGTFDAGFISTGNFLSMSSWIICLQNVGETFY